jgi:polyribonucleotide nucleotidyltransferase
LAGTRDAILMVECGAREIAEDVMVKALEFGHNAMQPLIDLQEKMAQEIGKPKFAYMPFAEDEALKNKIFARVQAPLSEMLGQPYEKADRSAKLKFLEETVKTEFITEDATSADQVAFAWEDSYKIIVRDRILNHATRPDGRALDEIRPIWCEVDVSPRAHGSGLFTRGETQVLTLATLGTPREAQELDNLTPSETKRYMHHYNFPPFSTGEVKQLRGASRREIGHGALAERALLPVIPP